MHIHICDTTDMEVHVNCGGFLWPDTVKVYCGKDLPLKRVVVERISQDDERICQECLRRHIADSDKARKNIITVTE